MRARSASSSRPRCRSAALWHNVTPRARALQVFAQLHIWDTQHNNGVLIYVLRADRAVEIIADRGISARVSEAEWQAVCREVEAHYRAGRYVEGSHRGGGGGGAAVGAAFSRRRARGERTAQSADTPLESMRVSRGTDSQRPPGWAYRSALTAAAGRAPAACLPAAP